MVKAKGVPMDSRTVVGDAEVEARAKSIGVTVEGLPQREWIDQQVKASAICRHPSGFLFMRQVCPDGATVLDLMYCPHCGERRHVAGNGRVVASCVAGGEWRAWE